MWLQGSPGYRRKAQAAGHGWGLAGLVVDQRQTFGRPFHVANIEPTFCSAEVHIASTGLAVHSIRSSRCDFAGSWFGFRADVKALDVQFVEVLTERGNSGELTGFSLSLQVLTLES